MKFPDCGSDPLGLYPIVNSVGWLEKLLLLGVKTIQLRIKDKKNVALEREIERAILIAKECNARLFINDYWELAIAYHAYGVHLGQEDLATADLEKIYQAGLRLGISTHNDDEISLVNKLNPSYIACGPIYPTQSKILAFEPHGVSRLQHWRRTLPTKVVAIGGITLERMPDVLATGVDGVAIISAITEAEDPIAMTQKLLEAVDISHPLHCITQTKNRQV